MIFFLKSCCSLNIYRSVGDGDNNNNQRKGVLAADVLLRLSESQDAERNAAPPASFQPKLLKRQVFRRRLMGCSVQSPPSHPRPGLCPKHGSCTAVPLGLCPCVSELALTF